MNKILITEDDPFIAHLYQTKFQSEGFAVTVAGDGMPHARTARCNGSTSVIWQVDCSAIADQVIAAAIASRNTSAPA